MAPCEDEDVGNCVLESKRRSIWARTRQLLMVTIVLELGGAGALGRSGQLHTSLWLVRLHVILPAKTSNCRCNTKARQKCWGSRDISICLVIVRLLSSRALNASETDGRVLYIYFQAKSAKGRTASSIPERTVLTTSISAYDMIEAF